MRWLCGLLALVCLGIGAGCHPEMEVYAPERELYAVYGVLNPHASEQFVRISKVYQYNWDAYAYASAHDLSARGLEVSLKGGGRSWSADLVDSVPKDPGPFHPYHAVYRFSTGPGASLIAGVTYQLDIRKPGDDTFHITAVAQVPTQPELTSPSGPVYNAETGRYTLSTLEFDEDLDIFFNAGNGEGFELRLYVDYWDGQQTKTARWGPTKIVREAIQCPANVNMGEMCIKVPGGVVPNGLRILFAESPGPVALYDTIRVAQSVDSLSKVAHLEVTSVDSAFTLYLHANDPFGYGANLLMDKVEYSNISGGNIGIFGAINTSYRDIFLGACTKYLSGLLPVPPSDCD